MEEKIIRFKQELREEFIGHMLPFWMNLKDEEKGGFYGLVDFDLTLDKKADKGCILNSRILWLFSNLYTRIKTGEWGEVMVDQSLKDRWLEMANHAYRFLCDAFLDKEMGGVYWSVTYDGKPADTTKHTYNQAFAIYALSSYYEATGNRDAFILAMDLYHLVEEKFRDEDGYLEAFKRNYELESNEKLSENGVMATRTMNTLLHIMEAYTELFRVDENQNSEVQGSIIEAVDIIKEKIYDSEKGRLEVFFDKDYNSLIDLYSYGHDIEAAWLIDRTEEVLLKANTANDIDVSILTDTLTRNIYDITFNPHGIPAEAENGKVLETRIWWVQCESMIGFMNGYNKDSSREEYLEAVLSIWEYVKEHVVDRRPGSEWFSEVRADNTPIETKPMADEWKCPYHNGRMFIEMMER